MNSDMTTAKQVFNTMMEKDFFSQWMQIKLLSIAEGMCQLSMTVRKEMLNGFEILHGGITFSLADSALAFASNAFDVLSISQEASLHFVSSAKIGDTLIATAELKSQGKKSAVYDVTIMNEASNETIGLFRGIVYKTSKKVLK